MKKRGFGQGRWNGFGGKLQGEETLLEAARRELIEEAGITPLDLVPRGSIAFSFADKPSDNQVVHLFFCSKFSGQPVESEEMRPAWFKKTAIPFTEMWPDDPYWLPHVLAGKSVVGEFRFEGHDKILEQKLDIR
jgi:8-oxo-dGTP diphosphatase / 2-hydroxy-dATP diphosphatase